MVILVVGLYAMAAVATLGAVSRGSEALLAVALLFWVAFVVVCCKAILDECLGIEKIRDSINKRQ